jgi:hypothetical protein
MMSHRLLTIRLLISACLGAYLGGCSSTITTTSASCGPVDGLHFICGIDKPEDLAAIPDTPWLITSGFAEGAGIKLINTQTKAWRRWYTGGTNQTGWDRARYPDCPGAPDAQTFNAQGISLRAQGAGRFALYVSNHGGREAIEVFSVESWGTEPRLTWTGCVPLPAGIAANAVSATADGTILITELAHAGTTYADFVNGKPTGGVYAWHAGAHSFRVLPGTELPGNNGLETSPDGKEFYVVAFGLHAVFAYSLADTTHPLRQAVVPNFMPDNLHWHQGRLLLAGMMYDEPACGGIRKVINGQADPMRCHRGYVVALLDPATMTFATVAYAVPNLAFNGVTTAVLVGNELWLGSYQADRIAYRTLVNVSNK